MPVNYGCATLCAVILDLLTATQAAWNTSIFLRAFLFCLLVYRKNLRLFPFFGAYLLINIAKAIFAQLLYKAWGMDAAATFAPVWIAEALVTCARALAVAELCRLMLGAYRGVWSFASRILLSCAGLIIIYTALITNMTIKGIVLDFGRAAELAIASVIVMLFVFLRYYEVVTEQALRSVALGLCVYACVAVINFSVLERYLNAYDASWNALGVFTFLVCLLVWIWALRQTVPSLAQPPTLFSRGVYEQLSPQVNARLKELNERLSQFWSVEAPPS